MVLPEFTEIYNSPGDYYLVNFWNKPGGGSFEYLLSALPLLCVFIDWWVYQFHDDEPIR